jgi:hypothetical protein
MERSLSALEQQAADALRRARRLPLGGDRNDLRQLAMGLLWLHRNGMDALMDQRSSARFERMQMSQDGSQQFASAEQPYSNRTS